MSETQLEPKVEPEAQLEPEVEPEAQLEPKVEPEAQLEPEVEPEAAVAPPEGLTEKELEAGRKRIDRAAVKLRETINEVMGDEALVLQVCPCCVDALPGLIFPAEIAPPEPEKVAAVMTALGFAAPNQYPDAEDARRCEKCDGWGTVASGSRVSDQLALRCVPCKGLGWVPVGSARVAGLTVVAPGLETTDPNTPREPNPDEDLWGRPVGDPNYGMHPQYVTA